MARDLAQDTALDVAKVVTALGSLPAVIVLVLATAGLLLWRGEHRPAAALVVGLILIYVVVHVTKNAYDRPRPLDAVTDSRGAAFPSAHAAYATAWVACAIALARALPTLGTRFSIVVTATIIAAIIGMTRIYLRVHWLSDVLAGWGLGAAVFATCGIVALVVGFVRDNPDADAPTRPTPPVREPA